MYLLTVLTPYSTYLTDGPSYRVQSSILYFDNCSNGIMAPDLRRPRSNQTAGILGL